MCAKPSYEVVIQRIYQYIDESGMKPGDFFPPERELAKIWGVSRNVLREAIAILEERGIVVSRQGQGRSLRSLPASDLAEQLPTTDIITRYSLLELYEVRIALETKSVALAAERATDEQIQELECLYSQFCARLFHLGTVRHSHEDQLHFKYLDISGNAYLKRMLRHQLDSLDMMFEKVEPLIFLHHIEDYVRDHGNIIRAIKEHNAEEAAREMERHLQTTVDILKSAGLESFRP